MGYFLGACPCSDFCLGETKSMKFVPAQSDITRLVDMRAPNYCTQRERVKNMTEPMYETIIIELTEDQLIKLEWGARETGQLLEKFVICAAIATANEILADASRAQTRRDFYVEEANGFWWVTERSTRHNYAQTDSKERANQICRDLNAGIRGFEEDGYSAPERLAPGFEAICEFEGGKCDNIATITVQLGSSEKWYACCDKHASYARRGKAEFRDLDAADAERRGT